MPWFLSGSFSDIFLSRPLGWLDSGFTYRSGRGLSRPLQTWMWLKPSQHDEATVFVSVSRYRKYMNWGE